MQNIIKCLMPSMLHDVYCCYAFRDVFQCFSIVALFLVLNHFKLCFSFSFTMLFTFVPPLHTTMIYRRKPLFFPAPKQTVKKAIINIALRP